MLKGNCVHHSFLDFTQMSQSHMKVGYMYCMYKGTSSAAGAAHRITNIMSKRSRSASLSSFEDTKYPLLEDPNPSTPTMRCLLPPHKPLTFPSYAAYETHYTQSHSNRCTSCSSNFPTAHFLSLHISENHDPLAAAKRDRGEKTHACFVEGCEKVCGDWKKRRRHLVDKHGFPRNYDFLVVNSGVDGKRSMLRAGVDGEGHRASSRERKGSDATDATGATMETEATSVSPPAEAAREETIPDVKSKDEQKNEAPAQPAWRGKKRSGSTRASFAGAPLAPAKTDLDDLTKSISALSMVPRSVAANQKKCTAGK